MISTSTTFNTVGRLTHTNTPQGSPATRFVQPGPTTPQLLLDMQQAPLLQQYFLQSSADDAQGIQDLTVPNPATVVRNLLGKSISEIRETSDQTIPRVGMMSTLRKSFRDFYVREQVSIFSFLNKPVDSRETLSTAQQILKKFGRADYNANRVKIRDLCLDLSCNEALVDINISLPNGGSYEQWVQQTRYLVETWKTAVAGMAVAEKKLETQLRIFNETYKRATAVLNLPTNDAYDTMLQSTEFYLRRVFEDTKIEDCYKEYLIHLKRMIVTTDAMNLVRLFVNSSSEPICPVCMEDSVCYANVPCGHTFCQTCGQKQTITCYICRTSVKDRQKLFFA